MKTNPTDAEKNWYKRWFDSPYYHLLYQHRTHAEAEQFIEKLLDFLQPDSDSLMLDLACGRGRHARFLASRGYDVTGTDLSPANIEWASAFEKENLSFFVQDMRYPFRINYFDYIFNFFTSFGYFIDLKDNLKTLQSVYSELKHGGIFILDFFNPAFVKATFVAEEVQVLDDTRFEIRRKIVGNRIIKEITATHKDQRQIFMENVALLELSDFEILFAQAGLKIMNVFGDYQLGPFNPEESPRTILMAQKI